jgi:hypothetical protein
VQHVKAFVAGFVSTLIFHQGIFGLLHVADPRVPAPFDMTATAPFQVPSVISLAFWGGVWGIVLWAIIKNMQGAKYWIYALVIGAVGPSVVAWFVVMPLKGMPVMGGWNPMIFVGALIVNLAWGFGVALLMRGMNRLMPAPPH